MKLYATTTSERASKGQGGNKDIQITLTRQIDGVNVPVYFVYFDETKLIIEAIPEQKEVLRIDLKGEKQKTAKDVNYLFENVDRTINRIRNDNDTRYDDI